MPSHLDAMVSRLPILYRDGELVRALLALPGLALEVIDEEGAGVRRSHFFDSTLELAEAARLALVIGFIPEPWQGLEEFRAWVHALRDAMLQEGAVTVPAIRGLVEELIERLTEALGIGVVPPLGTWSEVPTSSTQALIENPQTWRVVRVPPGGSLEPLSQFELENRGLDPSGVGLLIVGTGAAGELVPVVANVTTGEALVFRGQVPAGARLWIRAQPDGTAAARLEGDDVSERLYSVRGLVPGTPWKPEETAHPARALTLSRGKNQLWFFPLAHYDERGLDRFLLALPDLLVRQGRFDQAAFDQAIFVQEPRAYLYAAWRESVPASFRVDIPAGTLRSPPGELAEALAARDHLELGLFQALERVRAAGVASQVRLRPFTEAQAQADAVRVIPILRFSEVGPTGGDRLREAGGVFELTNYDDSTFR